MTALLLMDFPLKVACNRHIIIVLVFMWFYKVFL